LGKRPQYVSILLAKKNIKLPFLDGYGSFENVGAWKEGFKGSIGFKGF
jgi:hypothetical protein